MQSGLSAAHGALKLGFFISSLTVATLGARLAVANVSPDAQDRARALAIASRTGADLSDGALRGSIAADPALYDRHDPAATPPGATGSVHAFEGAPSAHWSTLTAAEARKVNASVPFSVDPNPAAKPFRLVADADTRARALTCMTQAIYYEAALEPTDGQRAVAQVVLNRMRHPIFPHSVCGVVFQGSQLKTGCQFSFTCDGSLSRAPVAWAWNNARAVAERALDGDVYKPVGEATHYHTTYVVPWWQPTVSKVAQVGAHIFYRWQGGQGLPGAFVGRYAGLEPSTAALAAAAQPGGAQALPTPEKTADGRVHAILQVAAAEPEPVKLAATEPVTVAALATPEAAPSDVKIVAPPCARPVALHQPQRHPLRRRDLLALVSPG